MFMIRILVGSIDFPRIGSGQVHPANSPVPEAIEMTSALSHIALDARTATDHFPGIGRYVINLAQALAPLLSEGERLILLRDPTQTFPWDLTALAGEQIQVVDIPLSPFSIRQQWAIPRLLHRLRADLYHSPYYLMPYWPDLPVVVTVYDLIPLLFPGVVSPWARLLFRWMTALALRVASHVIVISQATRRDLLAFYRLSPQKVTAIHLAADPGFHPLSCTRVERVRRKYALPEEYVLYLGINKPHKNLVRLIDAFSCITRHHTLRFALVIAGAWDSRYLEPKERVKALGLENAIRFLGPVPEEDLPALYAGAVLFVFPSLYEGFGLPVLEAMACGVPVACSDISSLLEVCGDAVLYFDPGDVESIAEVLCSAMTNPDLRATLQERGLTRTAQFSWEQTARETLDLYRRIRVRSIGVETC
jgi:glycosyltransferase involved in cell wall biosynthesis